jgi:pimeloyl-ACP methyl ester carboxylesterase
VSSAKLVRVGDSEDPEGVVLVVHGGASRRGRAMVSPAQLSVLRMVPVARGIARSGRRRLAVYRLLNSYRGWDTSHTPVHDIEWALGQLAQRHGAEVPVCLVGHSLGGRACVLAAGLPGVRSVVALAAFVYPGDADGLGLRGRQILFVHGLRDRIAPVARARGLAARLAGPNLVGFVGIRNGKHAMLAEHRAFQRVATDFVEATLLGSSPPPPVADVLAGQAQVLL